MNEVLHTIAKRSSTRKFKQEKLTREQIEQLLTAGLQAPTAKNEQEIHISVLQGDSYLLQEIEDAKRAIILKNADDRTKESVQNNPNNSYYNAPVVFLLSADKDLRWSKVDAGICVQSIALAAESMGLGSLIIGSIYDALHGEKSSYFAEQLTFPANYEFAIAIALGYKDTDKTPHEFSLEKNVSFIQ